ncbi:hypothetical protein PF005_g18755 [Phytophthora fragariae]|uniref:Uncharacterized protein n=1 Tax=Phytophthora fragariae TaxID=53985 RepID=A0A6A3R3I8_9STRA|nr:hypothetical protein PF003_g15894 [Phytophthora fragariae]KAE8900106.1 hypothetical protein PF003_g15891 [Phytophthora fragariae]KAE8936595.1 hypothetical protein PF009_g13486 [Phytophthora fragariae]KAE8936598.1 hypothetical protein PF009_g13483 [Phytophthora fragariae]KAE8992161.1 hypothetical protein PF011_g17647 [Phytophthora fragariae]
MKLRLAKRLLLFKRRLKLLSARCCLPLVTSSFRDPSYSVSCLGLAERRPLRGRRY